MSISFPSSVTTVKRGALRGTGWIEAQKSQNDFVIVNGILVEYDGEGGNVIIPDGVTTIGEEAFYECSNLTSISIPKSVKSIEIRAFWECGLTSVTLLNSVTSIEDYAFQYCI